MKTVSERALVERYKRHIKKEDGYTLVKHRPSENNPYITVYEGYDVVGVFNNIREFAEHCKKFGVLKEDEELK